MESLFASGRIVDLILLFMVVEAILLLAYRWRTGRGPVATDLLVTLLAGSTLLLALRAALVGASTPWIGACLLASLVAHLIDLRRRWR
jgi:hypothetical protein